MSNNKATHMCELTMPSWLPLKNHMCSHYERFILYYYYVTLCEGPKIYVCGPE